jgi:phage terminase large subunit GpA-like protein
MPPPDLLPSTWADEYYQLPSVSSAEPGQWTTYPYQRAIMDAFVQPEVETVACKKSKRIGWTKIIGAVIGYHIHQDPASILVVQPTIADGEGWAKEEIQPTIEETTVLRELVGEAKSRTSGNTITKKSYPGGMLHIVGANSPTGFRRITVRIVLFDEVDGYPPTAGTEGDQIELGKGRAETFHDRKFGLGSTPTQDGFSRIDAAWQSSSQGHYVLACPHCGTEHIRRFFGADPARQEIADAKSDIGAAYRRPVIIQGKRMPIAELDTLRACWICPECGKDIDHGHHKRMMAAGYWLGEDWDWRPGKGFSFLPTFAGAIGFHIWAGYSYSPNATPAKLAKSYRDARDKPEAFRVFINTVLGETYREPGEQLDHSRLMERREHYACEVPAGVLSLTAGADVQQDRVEVEVVGWGDGEENWSIDYQVFIGDTAQDQVWDDLLEWWRDTTWMRADGRSLRIDALAVDSGYLPKRVYRFVGLCKSLRVWPIKGRAGAYPLVEDRAKRQRRLAKQRRDKIHPEWVGVDEAKSIVTRRWRAVTKPGPGYSHFPHDRHEEWFKQATGERLVTRYDRMGRPVAEWTKIYTAVEALDCRVYAYAALLLADIDLAKLAEINAGDAPTTLRRRRRSKPPEGIAPEGWAL